MMNPRELANNMYKLVLQMVDNHYAKDPSFSNNLPHNTVDELLDFGDELMAYHDEKVAQELLP